MRYGQTSLVAALWNFNREEGQRSEGNFLEERIAVEIKFAFSENSIATVVGHVLCLVIFGVVDVIKFRITTSPKIFANRARFSAERSLSRINKSRY